MIRIGISACLMGDAVRYNGGHARDHFLTDTVARFVEFVPVCPEVDIGLGTPRETIRLVRIGDEIRLVEPKAGTDHSDAMRAYAARKAKELLGQGLNGFVFKKNSPSCGLHRVKIYDENGSPSPQGRGLFAEAITKLAPRLPVEEEGRLNDPRLRENFLECVFAHRRLHEFFARRWTVPDLVAFHTAEKLLLQVHDIKAQRDLGELVARSKRTPRSELAARYQERFMQALARKATIARHANVLLRLVGQLKRTLSKDERAELLDLIEDFRQQFVPLIVPLTLVRHYVRRYDIAYLKGQTYLEPHPKELMLRNHV